MFATAMAAECRIVGGGGRVMATTLTCREMEVLRLVAEGLPNKLIAKRLHRSLHTIKHHVHAILNKLQVPSRYAAALKARDEGWFVAQGSR